MSLQIVIPMGGLGTRFLKAGFTTPKPLINIQSRYHDSTTLINKVLDSLQLDATFTFITRDFHNFDIWNYKLKHILTDHDRYCNIIQTSQVTKGAAASVALALPTLDLNQPLMVCDCDTIFAWNIVTVMDRLETKDYDGLIFTSKHNAPNYSYAMVSHDWRVVDVAEKKVISPYASMGVHVWSRAKMFAEAYYDTYINNYNSEYSEQYITPTWKTLLNKYVVRAFNGPREWYHNINSPDDLKKYEEQNS